MSLLSSIEVVLKRQQEDVQLIATNYGRILTGDILRQVEYILRLPFINVVYFKLNLEAFMTG